MRNSSLPYVLTLVFLVSVGYGVWTAWRVKNRAGAASLTAVEVVIDEQASAPSMTEFTLTERSGKPFRSRDMLGEVWLASFFFTNCPAVCREVNLRLAALQEDDSLRDVRIVSITSDPTNDTPERLDEYAKLFEADPKRWLFCRGDAEYTRQIGEDFMKIAANGAAHSERVVVFDRAGKIRGRFIVTDSQGPSQLPQLQTVLQACLAEPPPSAEPPAEPEPGESSPSHESGAAAVGDTVIGCWPILLAVHPLAHANALLNATATVLLVCGYVLIKGRRETAHKRVMLSAFGVSVAFLVSYLAYHVWPVGAAATPFPGPERVKLLVYLPLLASHILLAIAVPVLAVVTITLGLRDRRAAHRRWARWTFPIWLYVSVTGVVVYGMLYWMW